MNKKILSQMIRFHFCKIFMLMKVAKFSSTVEHTLNYSKSISNASKKLMICEYLPYKST